MHRIGQTAGMAGLAWGYIFLYQFCSMEQTTPESRDFSRGRFKLDVRDDQGYIDG